MTAIETPTPLMKRDEVAALLRVHPTTVDRAARNGVFDGAITRTPGGQRRYKRAEVEALAKMYGWSEDRRLDPSNSTEA